MVDKLNAGVKRTKSVQIDEQTAAALHRLLEIARYIYENNEPASHEDGEGSITVMYDVERLENWIQRSFAESLPKAS
jgi:hypothetical protein